MKTTYIKEIECHFNELPKDRQDEIVEEQVRLREECAEYQIYGEHVEEEIFYQMKEEGFEYCELKEWSYARRGTTIQLDDFDFTKFWEKHKDKLQHLSHLKTRIDHGIIEFVTGRDRYHNDDRVGFFEAYNWDWEDELDDDFDSYEGISPEELILIRAAEVSEKNFHAQLDELRDYIKGVFEEWEMKLEQELDEAYEWEISEENVRERLMDEAINGFGELYTIERSVLASLDSHTDKERIPEMEKQLQLEVQ